MSILRSLQSLFRFAEKNLSFNREFSRGFNLTGVQKSWIFPFWDCPSYEKHFFFHRISPENNSLSPDSSGNPFCGGVRHKKIAADSGK